MTATTDIKLNSSSWTLVATGPAAVTFTLKGAQGTYAINTSTGQPVVSYGHFAPNGRDVSLNLTAGSYLFLKGAAVAAVSVN